MPASYPSSPVPSDDHLHDGELPFTAFGQFGEGYMDNRVFDQDTYWIDVKGTPHLLDDMTDAYRVNVIMFLRDGADYYYFHTVLRHTADLLLNWYDDSLHMNPDFLSYELGVATVTDLEPMEWLESTPLMRRLRILTDIEPQ